MDAKRGRRKIFKILEGSERTEASQETTGGFRPQKNIQRLLESLQ